MKQVVSAASLATVRSGEKATERSGVVVGLVTVILKSADATEVTVPLPAGVAQVPSPRQNVVFEALVPLFKLVTDRFPVTPVESGSPVALVRVTEVGVPKIGVVKEGEVVIATFPVPLMVYSPTTPVLLKRILVFVPLVIAVVPIIIPLPLEEEIVIPPIPSSVIVTLLPFFKFKIDWEPLGTLFVSNNISLPLPPPLPFCNSIDFSNHYMLDRFSFDILYFVL